MYQRILVPVDGSATSNCGLEEAIRVAQLTHGQLRLFHVIDDLSYALALGSDSGLSDDLLRSLRGEASRILDAAQAAARAAGIEADTSLCDAVPGPVQDKVAAEARDWAPT